MPESRSTALHANSIAGFVLAGGLSRRMGRDKALLPWKGGSLLDHMVHLLSTIAGEVRIVGRGDLPDIVPGKGPLGAILTALSITPVSKNLMVAVDLPLLTPPFLTMFRDRILTSPKDIVACKIGSDYPLCIGVDRSLLPLIADRVKAGNLALHRLIEESDSEILDESTLQSHEVNLSIFSNVNTPTDWGRLSLLDG